MGRQAYQSSDYEGGAAIIRVERGAAMTLQKEYGVKPGESCEGCGKDPCHGDTVYVYAIGGGYAYLCEECFNESEDDRQAGRASDEPYPEFIEAVAV